MTNTDKIIFFFAIFLFFRGWSKGFLQTILGPTALIIATLLSYFYYILTHNMVIAIAIGTIGPIVLHIILSMTIGTLLLATDKKNISTLSRFLGGLINTLWGEALLLMGFFLVLFIPLKIPVIDTIQNDIQQSSSYVQVKKALNQAFDKDVVGALDPTKLNILTDPKALEQLGKTKEFQEVLNDPLVKDLLEDPQINKAIAQKDISKLMQSPKFIAITKDPELLKKFLNLYSKILQPDPSKSNLENSSKNSTQRPENE